MDVAADGAVRLVLHNDEQTPDDFVRELLRTVFGQSARDAAFTTSRVERQGKAVFGPYPQSVARALLEAAQQRIGTAGHALRITTEAAQRACCDLCGAAGPQNEIRLKGKTAFLCGACAAAVAGASDRLQGEEFRFACEALAVHFAGVPRNQLVTTARQFPGHMRADVQVAIDRLFAAPLQFFGIHEHYRYETITFASLMQEGRGAQMLAPPLFHDVDIGEAAPVKCLHNGFWLCRVGELRYAVLLCHHREYEHESAIRIEIAVPAGSLGDTFVQRCFAELEQTVAAARSYRGKVLSLEGGADYRGRSTGVMVHRLPAVAREQVILPEATLRLLDRNVLGFVGSRAALRRLGQSTRKGILLYGPPGTGKTHTIRYLAANLAGHTTLLVTAGQVGALSVYMLLARLLQPAIVVIEDVDLIARDREEMGPCEESLLNALLNEMDGLKEDCDILFVLTTNRPEQLEGALAGRPGRIDQAIEVPLPDDVGRHKLVRLYGGDMPLDGATVDEIVRRTQGVSAAFIKELMRRLAQASVARDGGSAISSADVDAALNDMLFAGGRLNAALLGGSRAMAAA
jgi:ATP-dependent Clp protease adapter protein ClpS